MSELETVDPTAAEPKTYGSESQFMEKLDPLKQDEPLPFDSSAQGLEEAATERTKTAAERNVIDVLQFKDPQTGEVHDGDKIASKEFAADEITRYRAQKAAADAAALDAEMQAALDQHRAQNLVTPDGQRVHMYEQPQDQPHHDIQVEPQPETLQEPPRSKLAKAFEDPELRAEFEQSYGQTLAQVETARQQFAAGIQQANVNAVASLVAGFPELLQIQNEQQLQGALATMNPERKAALEQHFGRVQHIINAAQQQAAQQQQQQQTRAQQELAAYKEQQDNLAGKNWAHEPPETVRAIQAEVVRGAEEYGIPKQQLQQLYENNPVVRHHAFQNMMADAARYRLAQRAVARGQPQRVPQVQRPGAGRDGPRDYSEVSSLQARFNLNPNDKQLAATLIAARRASR